MTVKITSVQSAIYNEHGDILFTVSVGDVTGVVTQIFNRVQDRYNDNILKAWLADGNEVAAYVAPPTPTPRPFGDVRRQERTEEFTTTLDRLNPIWYASLTTEQQSSLAMWRAAWLDYPNNENNARPVRPEGIF